MSNTTYQIQQYDLLWDMNIQSGQVILLFDDLIGPITKSDLSAQEFVAIAIMLRETPVYCIFPPGILSTQQRPDND